ncbi:hypothetical protein GCM10007860_29060 [Chitiniphilus shinanonensis]|uniref:Uncharacterized protein n=1 Tax=Chitiniphilus shinanonensis TaxID=553088 RepID=A0ABQ6BW76_9NEIS|nr:DUF493 domain-containing protein [Chitiniphilus shinanonensis]GLS05749.1 hypothetical protein GCM10007860_29060 [Chitiniphilus shinanonensis]
MSTQFTDVPSQKLEDLVTFPALIPVKAVSHKNTDQSEFHAALVDVTALHVPGFHAGLVTIRTSSAGNYFAATLSVTFESVDQVHALDAALRGHPLVRMVL